MNMLTNNILGGNYYIFQNKSLKSKHCFAFLQTLLYGFINDSCIFIFVSVFNVLQ